MRQVTTLEELLPLVRDATTAREFGAAVIAAKVKKGHKTRLALEARDELQRTWTDNVVKHWLAPGHHSEEWREANREAVRKASASYYSLSENRERNKENSRARRKSNPQYYRDYQNKRRNKDKVFSLRGIVSNRIYKALQAAVGNPGKARPTLELLGCSAEEYRTYLEGLWEPGMTWDNYGTEWEVDHIVPVAAHDLSTEEGQRAAFHWSNCAPLWIAENRSKGSLHEGVRHRHTG